MGCVVSRKNPESEIFRMEQNDDSSRAPNLQLNHSVVRFTDACWIIALV